MSESASGDAKSARQEVKLDPAEGGIGPARLYFALLRQRFTGVVTFEQPEPALDERRVWFRGGLPIFTDWVSPQDSLGQVLLSRRIISEEAHADALRRVASEGGRLGRYLMEAEALDGEGLAEALRVQAARKLAHTFALRTGVAFIEVGEHKVGVDDELKSQVNVLGLVLQGVGAYYDQARIEAELADELSGQVLATPAFARYEAQFGFRPRDEAIVGLLARGCRVEDLKKPGIAYRRALQIIYVLWACQMLKTGAAAAEAIAAGQTAAAGRKPKEPKPAAPKPAAPKPSAKPPPAPKAKTAAARPAQAKAVAKPKPPPAKKAAPEKKAPKKKAPAQAASGEGADFEAELGAIEAKVEADVHAFELFGLQLDAGRKEVRGAWAELSKRFHPDGLETIGRTDLHDRVEKAFAALSEAYGVLSNKEEREKLAEDLKSGGTGKPKQDTTATVRNALEADLLARDADKLLKKGAYARAKELFEKALALSPEDVDTQAALEWCSFNSSARAPSDAKIAVANLERLLAENPKCARGHYFRGLLELNSLKNATAAKQSFAKALEADRNMTDAERQLRAIRSRQKQADKSDDDKGKGKGLRGLFGRK